MKGGSEQMKKVLSIEECEIKKTKNGKEYGRLKTNEGWMSCFDMESVNAIKGLKAGSKINVEVVESGEFQNIKKFLGEASEEIISKVDKVINKKEEKRNEKKEMYISYAKDCFCAIVTRISQAKFDDMNKEEVLELMNLAIEAVKKAEEEFK